MKRKRGRKKKKKKAGWWQNLQVVPILTYLWNINLSSIPIAGEEAVLDRTENFSKAMERGGWGGSMLDRSIQRGSERKQLAACPWSCGHYAPSYIHYIYIYVYYIFQRQEAWNKQDVKLYRDQKLRGRDWQENYWQHAI